MAKVKKVPVSENKHQYQILCPGCGVRHPLDDRWDFNEDYDNPTFSPSLDYTGGKYVNDGEEYVKLHCHSFIRDGKIQFLNDCTHDMAGQTVELPEI